MAGIKNVLVIRIVKLSFKKTVNVQESSWGSSPKLLTKGPKLYLTAGAKKLLLGVLQHTRTQIFPVDLHRKVSFV